MNNKLTNNQSFQYYIFDREKFIKIGTFSILGLVQISYYPILVQGAGSRSKLNGYATLLKIFKSKLTKLHMSIYR